MRYTQEDADAIRREDLEKDVKGRLEAVANEASSPKCFQGMTSLQCPRISDIPGDQICLFLNGLRPSLNTSVSSDAEFERNVVKRENMDPKCVKSNNDTLNPSFDKIPMCVN